MTFEIKTLDSLFCIKLNVNNKPGYNPKKKLKYKPKRLKLTQSQI